MYPTATLCLLRNTITQIASGRACVCIRLRAWYCTDCVCVSVCVGVCVCVCVCHSDVICEYPLKEMLDFHKARGAEATILVTKVCVCVCVCVCVYVST